MAGLISRQTRRSAEGIPGLKQLPVLGHLFRSDDFIRSETELVVLVTPYLVRSAPRDALQTPGENLPQPSDAQVTAKLAADGGFGWTKSSFSGPTTSSWPVMRVRPSRTYC